MRDGIVIHLVMIPSAEQKVGKAVELLLRTAEPARGTQSAVVAGVVVDSILRMKVADCGINHLILETHLQAVTAKNAREVHLRVQHDRVLILRVAALAAK